MVRLVVALLALVLMQLPAAGQRQLQPDNDLELVPSQPAISEAVEIVRPDIATGRVQRLALSDLLLRLEPTRGSLADVLRLANNTVLDRRHGIMRATLYLVAGGRLLPTVAARCDSWIEDMARCSVGCDGGAFLLKRDADRARFAMLLSKRADEADEHRGLVINACAGPEAQELQLAPTRARVAVQVQLAPR